MTIALIAGNGMFPISFIKEAKRKNLDLVIIAHKTESLKEIEDFGYKTYWVKPGKLGKIFNILKKEKPNELVFVGGIKKQKMLKGSVFDKKSISVLLKSKSNGDDSILKTIILEVESLGITVKAVNDFVDNLTFGSGYLTNNTFSDKELETVEYGFRTAKKLGDLDIAQACSVYNKVTLLVEGVDGTDKLIERTLEIANLQKINPILIKVSKPLQDLRVDMPAIGVNTINNLIASNFKGLVIEADKTIIHDIEMVINTANNANLIILSK